MNELYPGQNYFWTHNQTVRKTEENWMNQQLMELVIKEVKAEVENLIKQSAVPEKPGWVMVQESFLRKLVEIATRE